MIDQNRLRVLIGLLTGLATLALLPGNPWAQVAAPRHNPTALESTLPFNPAARAFQVGSRVGGTWQNMAAEIEDAGVTYTDFDGEGLAVNLSFVGEVFAFNFESFSSDTNNPAATPPANQHPNVFNTSQVELALRWDIASFGVGQQTRTLGENFGTLNVQKHSQLVYGISLQANKVWFLGFATGTETETIGGGADAETRIRRMAGAYHSKNVHAEIYHEVADEIKVGAGAETRNGDGLNLELLFGPFILGYESYKVATENKSLLLPKGTESRQIITLGWIPKAGWAISLSQRNVVDRDNPDEALTYTGNAFSVAYQY